ncbi:MAG: hypothetical protein ABW154_00135, partial [Dyella sp.]
MSAKQPNRFIATFLVLLLTLLAGLPAAANTVTISATPPGVTTKVAPNIVVTFDDSGSMSSTSIPDAMDSNSDEVYYYSATGNPIYFDPNVTYVVPPDATGAALGGIGGATSYTAAWRDGYCAGTLNGTCWTPSSKKYVAANKVDLSTAFATNFLSNIQAGNAPCPRNFNEQPGWYVNSNNCSAMTIPADIRGSAPNTVTDP